MEYRIRLFEDGSLGRGNTFIIEIHDIETGKWRHVGIFDLATEISCGNDMRRIAPGNWWQE